MDYIHALQKTIRGDVVFDSETLDRYSVDWSIFEVRPEVVVYPKDTDDIVELVHFVNEQKRYFPLLSLTPRAAGTDMTGGPLNDSIIVDVMKYMHGWQPVVRGDFGTQAPQGHPYQIVAEVTVLPGTPYRELEAYLASEQLVMPCFPASKDLCAVGGMVANNGAGEKSIKYGQNKDFVRRLKVVLYDGVVYDIEPVSKNQFEALALEQNARGAIYSSIAHILKRNEASIAHERPQTTKNASGYLLWDIYDAHTDKYDMTRLFVGAQGTTGIITEITYGLVPLETETRLAVLFLHDLDVLPRLLPDLLKQDVETLEMYDDTTLKFSMRFFKDFVASKGLFATLAFGLRFLPEAWYMLLRGVPRITMLVEFAGDKDTLAREIRETTRIAQKAGVTIKTPESARAIEKYWMMRRDSFKMLTKHTQEAQTDKGRSKKRLRTAPCIDDIIVDPLIFHRFFPELRNILDAYDLTFTIVGHIGSGNLHIIPFMDFNDPATVPTIIELSDKVYTLTKAYGGSFTAEHNDGLMRTPYLSLQFSDAIIEAFQDVKRATDPLTIFNPLKKVGATRATLQKYIQKPRA